jgi:hypothetical protein
VKQRHQGEDYPGHDRKRFLVHERSSQVCSTPVLCETSRLPFKVVPCGDS